MSETIHKVTKENGEEIELRFKKIKGKKQLKMLAFLAQILGGSFIKNLTSGKGFDTDIKNININEIISNLSDSNLDKLTDRFCSFVVSPPLHTLDEEKREEFFEQFELKDLIQMMIGFVMMALTGTYPDNEETLKK